MLRTIEKRNLNNYKACELFRNKFLINAQIQQSFD